MGSGRGLRALLAGTLLLGAACGERGLDRPEGGNPDPLPTQETRVRSWVEYRENKKSWVFRGDVVRLFEEPKRVESEGVVVDFYDGEEKYLSTLTAERGTIDRKTTDMEARGNVIVTNRDGARLETDWIRWNNKEEIIHTEAFVTLVEGRKRITGYGLRTDPGLENAVIERDVVAFTLEKPDER
ncbi:MAG: LPS export ABC transporter periplasmic protein LptC [Candidatus Eisenbacteria bacterium]